MHSCRWCNAAGCGCAIVAGVTGCIVAISAGVTNCIVAIGAGIAGSIVAVGGGGMIASKGTSLAQPICVLATASCQYLC